jgi:hypothetical protein
MVAISWATAAEKSYRSQIARQAQRERTEVTRKKSKQPAGKVDEPVIIETKLGKTKEIGGGENDKWNFRQMRLLVSALPGVNTGDKRSISEVGTAVVSGLMDLKPNDPIEGMLLSQIMVAHEAALDMYRRAWAQPPEYFEARCRYLQMADKAQRTLAILTERLDRHRGAGQQSITVRHVTVNADNAIVGAVGHFPSGSAPAQIKDQPNAVRHALKQEMRSEDPERNALPITCDAERAVPDARGTVPRRSEG